MMANTDLWAPAQCYVLTSVPKAKLQFERTLQAVKLLLDALNAEYAQGVYKHPYGWNGRMTPERYNGGGRLGLTKPSFSHFPNIEAYLWVVGDKQYVALPAGDELPIRGSLNRFYGTDGNLYGWTAKEVVQTPAYDVVRTWLLTRYFYF